MLDNVNFKGTSGFRKALPVSKLYFNMILSTSVCWKVQNFIFHLHFRFQKGTSSFKRPLPVSKLYY